MNIVVHGTKGGHQTFTPKKVGGLLDISADDSKPSATGQESYAVRFVENNIIFSKYKIVRDVRGEKRTGFVGFSLFLQNNEKLSGSDIIALLNRVSKEYCQAYIPENDNNLKDVREVWNFLNRIEEEYRSKVKILSADDIETLLSNIKDDAFIYYEDDTELQKYFDLPYQEEYSPYRQVLFVKEDLKDKPENPLNAIRHSEKNLTGEIDFENPKYKLLYNPLTKEGIKIEIKVNGNLRNNKSKIRRKDNLDITWSKPHYETKNIQGKWPDIENDFIEVNNSLGTVSIKEIELNPKIKTITFLIKPHKGGLDVSDAEIQIDTQPFQEINGFRYDQTFDGEGLGKSYTIFARKGDRLKSKEQSFIPENVNTPIEIALHEYRKVKFTATDAENGDNINNFKVSIQGKFNNEAILEYEFLGDDIDKTWNITFEKKGYISHKLSFNPRNHGSTVYGRLSQKKKGQGGNGNGGGKGEKKTFHKNPKLTIPIISIVFLLLGFGIWSLFIKSKPDTTISFDTLEKDIKSYVDGTELFENKLRDYELKWNSQKPEIKTEEKSWFSIFGIGRKEEIRDFTDFKHWKSISESIEQAIKKRNYINNLNIEELKKLQYSDQQKSFKKAISEIGKAQYEKLRISHDYDSMDLNKITKAIVDVIKPVNSSQAIKDKEDVSTSDMTTSTSETNAPKKVQGLNNSKNTNKPSDINKLSHSNEQSKKREKSKTIIKDGEASKIQNSMHTGDEKQKKFEEAFWTLIHKDQPPNKDDFDAWFKSGTKISSQNEYKKFYNEILSSTARFRKIKDFLNKPVIERNKVKDLSTLKEKLNKK